MGESYDLPLQVVDRRIWTGNWLPEETRAHRMIWATALRERELEPGVGQLRHSPNEVNNLAHEVTWCPLGIACQVFLEETGVGEWLWPDEFNIPGFEGYLGDCRDDLLPIPVQHWYGLTDNEASFKQGEQQVSISSLNDEDGVSFSEIADLIENEPEGLIASWASISTS